MNRLSTEDRAHILHLLCEGQSIRTVTRLTGASKNTVTKLLVDAGKACLEYHHAFVRNVKVKRIQVDEIWSFDYATQNNVSTAKAAPDETNDTWTWTAIEANSKLIVSYFVADRDGESAMRFIDDVRSRLENRVRLRSDGQKAYLEAVQSMFDADVDYAMLIKIYGVSKDSAEGRKSPEEGTGASREKIEGNPYFNHVPPSCVKHDEDSNMRTRMRYFPRLANVFSKKIENHTYAVALHIMYYNFVRIHSKLHKTAAMAAGVSDKLWEICDIAALLQEAPPGQ